AGAAADPALMPEFPGLAEARSCTDWEPGVPVELGQLDDRDQGYWDTHRGTPKAFVTLAAARAMWSNRFGSLTAVRAPADAAARLRADLLRGLSPAAIGLFFQDLRGPALAAGAPATDFGALYLGLSFFLILAALLLTVLLFAFGVEQREGEVGALLALGYRPGRIRGMFLREAAALTLTGGAIGAAAGVGYAGAVLAGLDSLWRDTVGQTTIAASVEPLTLVFGGAAVVAAAMTAIAWAVRRAAKRPVVELLAARSGLDDPAADPAVAKRRARTNAALALLACAGALWVTLSAAPARATSAFFAGGALLLLAALLSCRALLAVLGAAKARPIASVRGLAVRNAGRRPGRSLATIALLASGAFLILAIQANRLTPPRDPGLRASGTGGFALFGRSTLPVLRDLGSPEARDAYALDADALRDVEVVPLRVRPGDDASCLNLATAQNPQLVGVVADRLASRGAFRFTRTVDGPGKGDGWSLLDRDLGPDVVPAVGDGGSVAWALHKKVGDALRYRDEQGRDFEVRIVGTVADSILQGNLLIGDQHMRARFPSASGFRMFLVDAPSARRDAVRADLSDALSDIGLELTPTEERLAAFQTIQNTYLSIFQLLGGLGLLLGTAGLGVVVLRNTLERRGELATAHALGFADRAVQRMVWIEHALLLGAGLVAGVLAAGVAMIPSWSEGRVTSVSASALLVGALAVSGAFWVWAAGRLALRGGLLERLRAD
ncbi:MAG: FtsX-like permease family protein, partial [Planctomycetota bacterium]|nr:FtsX-like permease family protein [Planctomycetota bacterium]